MGLFRTCQLMDSERYLSAFFLTKNSLYIFPCRQQSVPLFDERIWGNLHYFHSPWKGQWPESHGAVALPHGREWQGSMTCCNPSTVPWELVMGSAEWLSHHFFLLWKEEDLPFTYCHFFSRDSGYILCCIFFHFLMNAWHLCSSLF